MTAKFWTRTGEDIWRFERREILEFTNLETEEKVTCGCSVTEVTDAKFVPITMPKVKKTGNKKTNVKKERRRGPRSKGKYKGVTKSKTPGKYRAQFWDKTQNKCVNLGTYDSELLAAAAYQEHIGNKKEARRLRNEYEEGDRMPESDPGRFPSEQ